MATVGEHLQVSSHTADKVTKLKLSLENFYSNLVAQHEEREHRSVGGQCSGQSQDPFFVTWLALLSVLLASGAVSFMVSCMVSPVIHMVSAVVSLHRH